MKFLICLVLVLTSFVGVADAQRKVQAAKRAAGGPYGSGNMATTQRYYGANGKQVLTERKYSDRSYFYSGKTGAQVGQQVHSRK